MIPSSASGCEESSLCPIFEKFPLQGLDPYEIYLRLSPQPPAFLLDSVKGPDRVARYSFIPLDPFLQIASNGRIIRTVIRGMERLETGDPLRHLAEWMARCRLAAPPGLPPFFGGAVGFLSYNLLHLLEEIPRTAPDDLKWPDLFFSFFESVVAIDHLEKTVYIIHSPVPDGHPGRRGRMFDRQARSVIAQIKNRIFSFSPSEPYQSGSAETGRWPFEANLSRDDYIRRVRRCQDYIAQGDIFQANLSMRLSAPLGSCTPQCTYGILRSINPSPFCAFADLGHSHLICSSPERLVRVAAGRVETRPIAGTRRRGQNADEDLLLKKELLTNAKERAEHLMLVDLERNDLGRVCRYGSLKVDEMMVTEAYSHVMHIVSNIQGELREGIDCLDVIRAVFPGGTVTGVPKVRCMQILEELEPVSRGIYTGSVGYISFAGDMDLNIVIRSLLIHQGRAFVQVGAGIVADSEPEREYDECLYKACAMLEAVRMAQGSKERA